MWSVAASQIYIDFVCVDVFCSLCWSDSWCKREATEGEGARAYANQGAAHYDQEDTLWRGFQDVGSFPDAYPQASDRSAQSIGDCQADCILS